MEVLGKIRKFAQFLKLDYNMDTIQIKDKRFKTFIPEADILKEVARVANEINHDLEGENPLFFECVERLVHVYGRFDETSDDSM